MKSQSAPEASADTSARYLEEQRSQPAQDLHPVSLPAAYGESLIFIALNDQLVHARHYVSPLPTVPNSPQVPHLSLPTRIDLLTHSAVPSPPTQRSSGGCGEENGYEYPFQDLGATHFNSPH